jgi:hypothetical protein
MSTSIKFSAILFLTVSLTALAFSSEASADSDSLVTVGAGARLVHQQSGATADSGPDTMLGLGLRAEFLYAFGAEFEYVPMAMRLQRDIYRSPFRLTGHLHLVNSRYFDFHLGVGMASDGFGDLLDLEGGSTVYRAGAGMEIIVGGHWAVGLDGYWHLPGVGHYNERLRRSLQEERGVPSPSDQVDSRQIEVGVALRYYL